MARIFITGSADGLGRAAAQTFSRPDTRSSFTLAARIDLPLPRIVDMGAESVVGDLADLEATRGIAEQVNGLGGWMP